MTNATIGHILCPAGCGNKADVRETKKKKAYVMCDGANGCGFQGFARGFDADKNIRAKMLPKKAEPEPAPVPVPEKPAEPEPVKAPAPAPVEKPAAAVIHTSEGTKIDSKPPEKVPAASALTIFDKEFWKG